MWLNARIVAALGALVAAVSVSANSAQPQNASAYNLCQLRDRLGSNGTQRMSMTH